MLIAALIQLRPLQWTKNGMLFIALVFSGQFVDLQACLLALQGFAAFCLISSGGYILNDILDREADRRHPKKKHRPIASGALSVPLAWGLLVAVWSLGITIAWILSPACLGVALLYLTTTLSYSFYFKHQVILDVMVIAMGFVWRAFAGAIAIDVKISIWLFLCTAFLALFLGFNKRRAELVHIGDKEGTRAILADYSAPMLEQFQAIVTAGVVLCYSLYTILGTTHWMTLTLPFVLYGIFRYIYLVDKKGEGGAPDETLLRDRPIQLSVLLYLVTAMAVLYFNPVG